MAANRFTVSIFVSDVVKGPRHFGRQHQLFNIALRFYNLNELGCPPNKRATTGKRLTRQWFSATGETRPSGRKRL
ncbi:hypothetical protein MAUB1S_08464 [Mycolicibacterium aubagnense]